MRILNTGTEVEAAVADALVSFQGLRVTFFRATLFISSERQRPAFRKRCCVHICFHKHKVFIFVRNRDRVSSCLTVTWSRKRLFKSKDSYLFSSFYLFLFLFTSQSVYPQSSEVEIMLLKVQLIRFRYFPVGSLSHLCPLDYFFPIPAIRRLPE